MTLDVSSNVGRQCLPLLLLLLLQRWRAILRHYRVIVIVTCRTAPYSVPQPSRWTDRDWPVRALVSLSVLCPLFIRAAQVGGPLMKYLYKSARSCPGLHVRALRGPRYRRVWRHTGGLEATRPGGHVSSPRFGLRAVSPACPPCLWTTPRHVLIRGRIRQMEINHYTD